MRWEMGCPTDTADAREGAQGLAERVFQRRLGTLGVGMEHHVDLRSEDGLGVLIELSTAGAAGGSSDLRQRQDELLGVATDPVCRLQRRSGYSHQPYGERAFVEWRQEAPAKSRHQGHGPDDQEQRQGHHQTPVLQGRRKQRTIGGLEPANHPTLGTLPPDRAQKQQSHHRRHRRGHQQGRADGDDERPGQRLDKPAFDAAEEEQGDERHQRDQGGVDDGRPHLGGGVHHQGHEIPLTVRLPPAAEDVLGDDDGVIDDDADGDCEATEGHGVEGHVSGGHGHHRCEQGQGNGQRCCERRAQVPQEQQQHDDHEDHAIAQSRDNVSHSPLDERRLPEPGFHERNSRERVLHVVDGSIDTGGNRQGIHPGLLEDGQDNGGLCVHRRRAPHQAGSDGDIGYVTHQHRLVPSRRHNRCADFGFGGRRCEPAHRVFLPSFVQESRRRRHAGVCQSRSDLSRSNTPGGETDGIEQDVELPGTRPHDHYLGDTGDGQEPGSNRLVGHGPERLGGAGFVPGRCPPHTDEDDFAHHRGDGGEDRSGNVGGQVRFGGMELLLHDAPRSEGLRSPVKLHPHDGQTRGTDAADPANSCRAVHRRLDGEGHQTLDLFGHEPGSFSDHSHRRRRQVREHVHRHGRREPAAGSGQEQRSPQHHGPPGHGSAGEHRRDPAPGRSPAGISGCGHEPRR